MSEPTDPIQRSEQLQRRILAIPEDAFLGLQRRFKALIAAIVVALAFGVGAVLFITSSTRSAVEGEVIPALEDQIAVLEADVSTLEADNAELEDISRQQTDAIVLLLGILDENKIEAPEIIIRSTTTTTPED